MAPSEPARRRVAARRAWLPAVAALVGLGALLYYFTLFLPLADPPGQAPPGAVGYHSDLYSRWYGARELLLHGRDPYSAEVTAEMRRGYAGRDLAPGETWADVAVFAQPLYTAFLLAPLTWFDFLTVRVFAQSTFPLLIVLGTLLWLAVLRPAAPWPARGALAVLALTAPATLYAGTWQQLTAVVYVLLAGAVYLVARGHYGGAGVLLALSTIKPQESGLIAVLLLLWATGDWRARRGLAGSFGITLAALVLASEWVLPGWPIEFANALVGYSQQTGAWQMLQGTGLPGAIPIALALIWLGLFVWAAWQVRGSAASSRRLAGALAGALAIALIVLPTYLLYEHIYLLPALLALLWLRSTPFAGRIARVFCDLALVVLLAPWVLAALMSALNLLGIDVHAGHELLITAPLLPYALAPYLCAGALLLLVRPALDARVDAIRQAAPAGTG